MIDVYDRDRPCFVVDPVDDPVAAPAGTVPIVQRRQQTPADTMRIVQQWSVDKLERGECNRFGKPLSEHSTDRGGDAQ
ncbi:MAG TPA: hypothetical protein VGJ13_14720 [Pseudonocardiaceae bacterium]